MTERKPIVLQQPVQFIEGQGVQGDTFDVAPRPMDPKDLSAQELASVSLDDSPANDPPEDIPSLVPSSNSLKSNPAPADSSGSSESSELSQNSQPQSLAVNASAAKVENPKQNSKP